MKDKQLQTFQSLYPELELVHNDAIHAALHETEPDWWIFISRHRGTVEVHDVHVINGDQITPSHVFTEPYVSWKIPHDAKKYNSKFFNLEEYLTDEEKREDAELKLKASKDKAYRLSRAREILYHN